MCLYKLFRSNHHWSLAYRDRAICDHVYGSDGGEFFFFWIVARLVSWTPYCLSGVLMPLCHISYPLAMPAKTPNVPTVFGSVIGKYGDFGFVVMVVVVARCPTHRVGGVAFPPLKGLFECFLFPNSAPYVFIHLFSRISFDV